MEKLTSIWQIDEIMMSEIGNRNENISYHDGIKRLFRLYRRVLKGFTWDGGMSVYEKEKDVINKYIRKINEIFNFHSKGKLTEFNVKTNNLFRTRGDSISAQVCFPRRVIEENSYWFRVRESKNDKRFGVGELFHVPFDLRGKIGTERFSIPGYPCLYMASTLECARESIGNPGIVAASCLKNKKPITVYDFSFFPNEGEYNIKKLRNFVVSYPFKIAASIATITNEEHKDDKYREEYIIPQLLLHCTVRQSGPKNVMGILYSSMNAIQDVNIPYGEYEKHLNLAVPAIFNYKGGRYCSILTNMFTITQPEVVPFIYLDKEQIEEFEMNIKTKTFQSIKNNW